VAIVVYVTFANAVTFAIGIVVSVTVVAFTIAVYVTFANAVTSAIAIVVSIAVTIVVYVTVAFPLPLRLVVVAVTIAVYVTVAFQLPFRLRFLLTLLPLRLWLPLP
jgi:uncharacterized Tic20 family protein